LDYYIQIFIRR